MQIFHTTIISLSAISFIIYGASCIFTDSLTKEFERYKLPSMRRLIGFLEISGGAGLLIGFYYSPIQRLSALCLALLMLCAVFVRFKIRDSILSSLPALILFILNLYISVK